MRRTDEVMRQVAQLRRAADGLEKRATRMKVRGPRDRLRQNRHMPDNLLNDEDCDVKMDSSIVFGCVSREIAEPLRDDIAGYLNRVATSLRWRASELLKPESAEPPEVVVGAAEADFEVNVPTGQE